MLYHCRVRNEVLYRVMMEPKGRRTMIVNYYRNAEEACVRKNKCFLSSYNHGALLPAQRMHLFWKSYFPLRDWHWRLYSFPANEKTPCSLDEASALRTQTHISYERQPQSLLETSCQMDRAVETWPKPARWTEERVNSLCLLGEQGWSSGFVFVFFFFCKGNRVYIVTVVCEENAMICFDSSPNVPVKCECACLIASCAKHSTECVVFK